MKKKGKKNLEYFLPFFLFSISPPKKKKVPQLEKSFVPTSSFLIFITHNSLPKDNPSPRRTGPQTRENSRCCSFIWTAHKAKGRQGRRKVLTRAFHQREPEVLPIVANRLPPTGRESDLMDSLSLQAAMKGMSGHPKNSYYPSSLPIPPQSHKPKEPQLLSSSRQLRHKHCSTSLTILCILTLRID